MASNWLDLLGTSSADGLMRFLSSPSSTDNFLSWLSSPSAPRPRGISPAKTVAKGPSQQYAAPRGTQPSTPIPAYTGTSGTGVDNSSRAAFITSMMPYAKAAEAQTGIPAAVMIAINLNEQGWQLGAPGNNYFGIKADPGWQGATTGQVGTWEDYGQGRVNTTSSFRAYDNPADSYTDFGNFLNQNPRYGNALEVLRDHQNWQWFVQELHKAGYATDPNWSNKIIDIAQGLM